MGYGPPKVVEAEPRQGLPYGLFSVLRFRPSEDEHWANGIEWEPMTCEPASGIEDPDCDTFADPGEEKFFQGSGGTASATAFAVYGSYKCGMPGGSAFAEAESKAEAMLLAREEGQAEAALWRRLAAEATDLHPSGPLTPVEALAALEWWMGQAYGSLGVVHADRGAATLVSRYLKPDGPTLKTRLGTPVVAGGGYNGSSPGGDMDADVSWIYASPALLGYRGSVFTARTVDQEHNDVYALAERQYVVGFDPCGVAAVRMNLA